MFCEANAIFRNSNQQATIGDIVAGGKQVRIDSVANKIPHFGFPFPEKLAGGTFFAPFNFRVNTPSIQANPNFLQSYTAFPRGLEGK